MTYSYLYSYRHEVVPSVTNADARVLGQNGVDIPRVIAIF